MIAKTPQLAFELARSLLFSQPCSPFLGDVGTETVLGWGALSLLQGSLWSLLSASEAPPGGADPQHTCQLQAFSYARRPRKLAVIGSASN